jgi:hypothetical protein
MDFLLKRTKRTNLDVHPLREGQKLPNQISTLSQTKEGSAPLLGMPNR